MTDKSTPQRNKGRFVKGLSGNPAGRPKQDSALIREQLAEHKEAVIQKVLDLALEGDVTALKMIMDRIAPTLKPVSLPSAIEVPDGATFTEMAKIIINQSIAGEIAPNEAAQLLNAIQQLKSVNLTEMHLKVSEAPLFCLE